MLCLWDLGINNDLLPLIYQMNENCSITIRTPLIPVKISERPKEDDSNNNDAKDTPILIEINDVSLDSQVNSVSYDHSISNIYSRCKICDRPKVDDRDGESKCEVKISESPKVDESDGDSRQPSQFQGFNHIWLLQNQILSNRRSKNIKEVWPHFRTNLGIFLYPLPSPNYVNNTRYT